MSDKQKQTLLGKPPLLIHAYIAYGCVTLVSTVIFFFYGTIEEARGTFICFVLFLVVLTLLYHTERKKKGGEKR